MKIKIVDALVGNELQVNEMDHTLRSMQQKVGGNIELVRITDRIDMWCNEEGKFIEDLEPNFYLYYNDQVVDVVMGNCFFTSNDGVGETIGLNEDQIREIESRVIYMQDEDGKLIKTLFLD